MSKPRLIAALAALLVLLFAAPAPAQAENIGARWPGTIRVYDATGDARWEVAAAVHEWAASGVPIVMSATPCAPGCVTVIVDPYITTADNAVWSRNGTTITSCTLHLLRPQLGLSWAHHAVTHGLGHCWGLAHTTQKGSDMRAGQLSPCCPTQWDLNQLRRLYRLVL